MRPQLRVLLALSITAPSLLFASDKLVFAVDVIRHGDRTPLTTLPTVNYQWTEGLGQLTAVGMKQEYEMGVKFRKRYVDETHLLPEHYEAGTMYVRSTDYDRTLMSAESLLLGLYPHGTGPKTVNFNTPALPDAFQPVPIHSAPVKYDDVIISKVDADEREKLMRDYVYSTKEWLQKNMALKPNYPRWSQLTGMNIATLDDLEVLGDTLYVHQVHNIPMPAGLTTQDIETIIDASDWVFSAQEKPSQIAEAYNKQLMTNIAKYLQSGSQQSSKLKYVLLSAHDTTVAGALSYLGAPLDKSPPYASNVNFSLYETGANTYVVKVTYNGSPVSIPACGGMVCSLQRFNKLAMQHE